MCIRDRQCWQYTRHTFPKLLFGINYCACVLILNTLNLGYSLAFEDYCNRYSPIYDTKTRSAKELLQIIKKTNEQHKKTTNGQAHTALTPDEVLK